MTARPGPRSWGRTVRSAACILCLVAISACARTEPIDRRTSPRRPSTTAPTTDPVPATIATSTVPPPIPPTRSLSPDAVLDHAKRSIVRIRNTACAELSVGSGWLTADGSILTNRHVVEHAHEIDLLTWDGIDLAATDVSVATELDVARVSGSWSNDPELVPLSIRADRVRPEEPIMIVGFPEGQQLAVSSGVAVGYGPDPDEPTIEVLKLTTPVAPGNSGGPALDAESRVVGIAYARDLATNEALVIPIQAVEALPATAFHPNVPCR